MSVSRMLVLGVCAWTFAACGRYVEIGKRAFVAGSDGGDDVGAGADVPPEMDAPVLPVDTGNDQEPMETPPSSVLWFSNLETGDFSEWAEGGQGGNRSSNTRTSVTMDRALSGSHAIKISFDTSDGASDHMAEFRRQVTAPEAYYSAWYFIDRAHTPGLYWTVFYFFYVQKDGTRKGLWDVNLNTKGQPEFFNELTGKLTPPMPAAAYPVGQWFLLEAYFSYQPTKNGHLTVWLGGQQILDLPDLGQAPTDNLYWGIGSDNDEITPSMCTMYIDDAKISTTPVGH